MSNDASVKGVDVSAIGSAGFIQDFFHEFRGVLLVIEHKDDLKTLRELWAKKELTSSDVLQKLQELANLGEMPYEWIIGTRNNAMALQTKIQKALDGSNEKVSRVFLRNLANQIRRYLKRTNGDSNETIRFNWWPAAVEAMKGDVSSVSSAAELFFEKYPEYKQVNSRRNRQARRGRPPQNT